MAGHRLHLDFETRSSITELSKVGVYNYARHPHTDVWVACYAIDDQPVRRWYPGQPLPADLRAALDDPDTAVVAHNAMFEWHIIEFICAPRYDWPRIPLERLDDTAARAAMMSLPRDLAGAAREMGLSVEKDNSGRQLMLQMMKPRKPRKDEHPDTLLWWDDADRIERLSMYCEQDVDVERELDQVLLPLPAREQELWLLTARANLRGVAVDMELVEEADSVARQAITDCSGELRRITDGELTSVNQTSAIVKWLQARGVDCDSVKKDAVTDLLQTDLPDDTCRRVLELRQDAAKSSTAKLAAFRKRVSDDGRMRENTLYHGAGTGRWSGMGVQLQNMPRPELSSAGISQAIEIIKRTDLSVRERVDRLDLLFEVSVPAVVASCLRGCIVAGEGNVLRVADYANIEGRTTAWQAGQHDKVELFRQKAKIYERMASAIFGIPSDQISKESDERFLGKTTELGCGYGMGAKRFQATCEEQGVPISLELAQTAVDTFREVNYRIKQFWYDMEDTAVEAMQQPGLVFRCRDIQFQRQTIADVTFLVMRLPSGRKLYYPHARLQAGKTPWGSPKDEITYLGKDPLTQKWCRTKTYGGKLVENAIQAEARDLLGKAMIRLDAKGYPVVLTVHDETVSETPADSGDQDEFERLMERRPKWAAGCPVAVEGYCDTRYRK